MGMVVNTISIDRNTFKGTWIVCKLHTYTHTHTHTHTHICVCVTILQWVLYRSSAVGEKCETAFSFHIQFFAVTYSPFVVFGWCVTSGVEYGLPMRVFHCPVRFQRAYQGTGREKCEVTFSFDIQFFQLLIRHSPFFILLWWMGKGMMCQWEVVTTSLDSDGLPCFCRSKMWNGFFFNSTLNFSQLLIRYSSFSVGLWLKEWDVVSQ